MITKVGHLRALKPRARVNDTEVYLQFFVILALLDQNPIIPYRFWNIFNTKIFRVSKSDRT